MKNIEAQEFINLKTKQELLDAYKNEYLVWKRTGVLPNGIIRDAYNILCSDGDTYLSVIHADRMFQETLAELWYKENKI